MLRINKNLTNGLAKERISRFAELNFAEADFMLVSVLSYPRK